MVDRKIVEYLVMGKPHRWIKEQLGVGAGRLAKVQALAQAHGYLSGQAMPAYPQALFADRVDRRSEQRSAADAALLARKEWIEERLRAGKRQPRILHEAMDLARQVCMGKLTLATRRDDAPCEDGIAGGPNAHVPVGVQDDEPAARKGPATVTGELDGQQFAFDDWAPDQKLLDFLLAKGLDAPYSCREGNCSACACRVLEGEVSMMHNEVLDEEDLADGIRLACQSLPVSDEVTISYE